MKRLSVRLKNLEFRNPVLPASGTFGFGREYSSFFDLNTLGGILTKSITLSPRTGNPQPRIYEVYGGVLNSIGLENPGISYFVDKELPFIESINTIKIVSIAGSKIEDYVELSSILENTSIDAIEINLSCPNVEEDYVYFGEDESALSKVIKEIRSETGKFLIVKLSSGSNNIVNLAKKASEAGVDAVCIGNTIKGMAIDIDKFAPVFKNKVAGLSGPAIKPIALRAVWDVYEALQIPIIGCGGIMNFKDALEFIFAGASLVQVGTANFSSPLVMPEIISDLYQYCDEKNIAISDFIGIAHKGKIL
jgi:dihydroorotate dehydrogenase (NAD+) catalytic subunit